MSQARVTASNSSPVKFRKSPNGEVIRTIAQGTVVKVLERHDETWSKIEVGNEQGYMMTKFLAPLLNDFSELKAELRKVLQLLDKLEDKV